MKRFRVSRLCVCTFNVYRIKVTSIQNVQINEDSRVLASSNRLLFKTTILFQSYNGHIIYYTVPYNVLMSRKMVVYYITYQCQQC